ncbi:SGNH/GDSL hydrolase family protein [Metabacillus sp. RGM 3146]|uniref:SGNH/GDSL hydrolase family protein n=1 Tax=Metabacillus sp. RGM 3146 TaxID=3401092 RepID=UPI003B9C8697
MKIICFGDSLTRGVSFVKGRLRILKDNYPAHLEELFAEDKKDVNVINKGVFNDNSDTLLKRVQKDVINEHPDFAIIGIGGNDCNFKWDEVASYPNRSHEAIVPLDRYMENVAAIVEKIKQSGITPVITTMPPLDPVRYYSYIASRYSSSISHWISAVGGIEHWHGMYNRSLNKLADDFQVMKIDVRSAIKQAGSLLHFISDDGIHLTSEGYQILGREVARHFYKE